jgi:hypothetical protein
MTSSGIEPATIRLVPQPTIYFTHFITALSSYTALKLNTCFARQPYCRLTAENVSYEVTILEQILRHRVGNEHNHNDNTAVGRNVIHSRIRCRVSNIPSNYLEVIGGMKLTGKYMSLLIHMYLVHTLKCIFIYFIEY